MSLHLVQVGQVKAFRLALRSKTKFWRAVRGDGIPSMLETTFAEAGDHGGTMQGELSKLQTNYGLA